MSGNDAARQFSPLADAYAASASHAQGRTLGMLLERAAPKARDVVLDVATGAGHTAIAFARHAGRVVALDASAAMVRKTLGSAQAQGLELAGVVSLAEALPLRAASFTVVTCRTAAHHFDDPERALGEMRRVLAPGGRLAITDQLACEDPALRELQQRVEVLHDPTHRRAWTKPEWVEALERAGFREIQAQGAAHSPSSEETLIELEGGTNVAEWCARSRTPPESEAEIRRLLEQGSAREREGLGVSGSGASLCFLVYKIVVSACVPR